MASSAYHHDDRVHVAESPGDRSFVVLSEGKDVHLSLSCNRSMDVVCANGNTSRTRIRMDPKAVLLAAATAMKESSELRAPSVCA